MIPISSWWCPGICFFFPLCNESGTDGFVFSWYNGLGTWCSDHPWRWLWGGAWDYPNRCGWEGKFRMDCWLRWHYVLQKISVSCDRASSFLLENFPKGAGEWNFFKATANSKSRGGFHCIRYELAACLWDIHPVALMILK